MVVAAPVPLQYRLPIMSLFKYRSLPGTVVFLLANIDFAFIFHVDHKLQPNARTHANLLYDLCPVCSMLSYTSPLNFHLYLLISECSYVEIQLESKTTSVLTFSLFIFLQVVLKCLTFNLNWFC